MAERRLIKQEPWLLPILRKRRKIILEPLRNSVLDFLIEVSRRLRDRESWVEATAGVTQSTVLSYIIGGIIETVIKKRR